MKKIIFIILLCVIAGCESQYDEYDLTGYNFDGYDREGYTIWGYNKKGYNREGFNREGYNRKGKYNPEYDQRLNDLLKKTEKEPVAESPPRSISQEEIQTYGTGFLLSETGMIATNYHVVKDKFGIQVLFPNQNKKYNAELKLKDISNDLAILALKDFTYTEEMFSKKIPYAIRRSSSVKLGEATFAIGFPYTWILGTRPKYSDGTISSLYGYMDTVSLFQISNPIQSGNSGGPLFDIGGNLIGVVVASLDAKVFFEKFDTIPQNVNFAIKSDYLVNLISMLSQSDTIIERPSMLKAKEQHEQVESLLPYVVIIYGHTQNLPE